MSETMFWTMGGTAKGDVTLCEAHALEATNMGASTHDDRFESMEEAAAILSALAAMVGIAPLDLRCSPDGACGECETA